MSISSRVASKPCIYWNGSHCIANTFFSETKITCYNSGNCDGTGNGTCLDCSRYYYGGLSTLSALDASREDNTEPASYDQRPIQFPMYNLRAKLFKCCNWNGSVIDLTFKSDGSPNEITTKCSEVRAEDWQKPWVAGSRNTSIFPCNGSKPNCPYYTGPKFVDVVDDKMEPGIPVSAAQIMELRFYSKDWSSFSNPGKAYRETFGDKEAIIWAWGGDFDDARKIGTDFIAVELENEATTASLPRLQEVTLFKTGPQALDVDARGFETSLYIGEPIIATKGTDVEGKPPTFPTVIKDISDFVTPIKIKWPAPSSQSEPFVFRSFRIGLNKAYVIVTHDSPYTLYAVNLTKHPQSGVTDEAFVLSIQEEFPDDLYTSEPHDASNGSIFIVDLEYQPEVNIIKIYTAKENSSDGSMYTDMCYIKHLFYHAQPVQTSFEDTYGSMSIEPWVDRFLSFNASVEIKQMSKNKCEVVDVLWDTSAYNRSTIYEIEHYVVEEDVSWVHINCNLIAITINNENVNPVQGWKIEGNPTAPYISQYDLGVWVDRTDNTTFENGIAGGLVKMSLVSKSGDGRFFPANVIFVTPDTSASDYNEEHARVLFDKRYDKVIAKFAYTEYKQGPVTQEDVIKLKYSSRYSTNESSNRYIPLMPYKVDVNESVSFNVEGFFIPSYYKEGGFFKYFSINDFENIISKIENDIDSEERKAIESFANGGTDEDSILNIGVPFLTQETLFNSEYSDIEFYDGTTVTLSNLCSKLASSGYYDGTQEYRVVFSDETGRPVGIKRLYLLMQSSVVSCRDVEIFYRWKTKKEFALPEDEVWLTADFYKPMVPGGPYSNGRYLESIYTPKCGDHSWQSKGETFFTKVDLSQEEVQWDLKSQSALLTSFKNTGYRESGVMWYPYKACSMPHYDRKDALTDYILCVARVEGFKDGKRRAYWEAVRGDDYFYAVTLGPQYFLGCTWSYIDANWHTIGAPVFDGYTRIRSGHIFGSFQNDREALRISRHFKKDNVGVRELTQRVNETTGVGDNSAGTVELTTEAESLLFPSGSSDKDEKPVWTHIMDGFTVVDRTSPNAKQPFSNVLMQKEGAHSVLESVDSSKRYSAYEIFTSRDLTLGSSRPTTGTNTYSPEEARLYLDSEDGGLPSTGSDIYWVYNSTNQNIGWAWLEIQKPLERAVEDKRINGIHLYNPTVSAWTKDLKAATYSDEGIHDLVYTPPVFNDFTGALEKNPTLSWFGGKPREIDWNTGIIGSMATDSYERDIYDTDNYTENDGTSFSLFGEELVVDSQTVHGFLADSSGSHIFEDASGNKIRTLRGIGIRPSVFVYLLPSTQTNVMETNVDIFDRLTSLEYNYSSTEKTYEINLGGYKYLESVSVSFSLGLNTDEQKRYVFPGLYVDGLTLNDLWVTDIIRFSSKEPGGSFSTENLTEYITSLARYKKVRIRIPRMPQRTYIKLTDVIVMVDNPVALTEKIHSYERKFVVSRLADVGTRDSHSDLYYYYGRSSASFGIGGIDYEESSSSSDFRWTSRSAKDVLLTYFFMDPTGEVYDYPNSLVSSIEDIEQPNTRTSGVENITGGVYYVDGPLRIHTKGQTVLTSPHVTDPIEASSLDSALSDIVSPDEYFINAGISGRGFLDEYLQEKLYKHSASLLGSSAITTYNSYWSPDEEDFFVNTVGIEEMPSWNLTLKSNVPGLNKLMRHQNYGCEYNSTNEYHDGRIHRIPPWKGLGHLLYFGNPVWNWSCFKVILTKIKKHLGEVLFEDDPEAYRACRRWPPDSVIGAELRDADYYISNKIFDDPSTYVGGTMNTTMPLRIGDTFNYVPGGVPNADFIAASLFPQAKSWPSGDSSIIEGYRKFGKNR